ncbi:MAG: PKD domain-containing protein [Chitinophagaceae bacterium]|nr:PKD domain-containing protein [Chitinophagaceae bacterium]
MRKFIQILFLGVMLIVSCKKGNDAGGNVKAVFSYVPDGFKVTFTDFSTNAKAYFWEFGDGDTSNMHNPLHIYHNKGSFIAKLTVTNGAIKKSFEDTVFVAGPNIKIDGDFTDWEYVDYTFQRPDSNGTILAVKTYASPAYLNFYLEGKTDMKLDLFDMFIDADNNPATGFQLWMYPMGSGAEYLCEGGLSGGSVFLHTGGDNSGWSWDPVTTFDVAYKFSSIKTAGGKNIIEFSVKRDALGTQKNYVNFAFHELNPSYSIIGSAPVNQQPSSKYLQIKL